MSLRDEIQRKGLPTRPFTIPGIDTPLAVRALSPAQMMEAGKRAEGDGEETLLALVAAWVLVDPETGGRHFTDDDAPFLWEHLTLDVLKRVGDLANELAGVAADEGKGG